MHVGSCSPTPKDQNESKLKHISSVSFWELLFSPFSWRNSFKLREAALLESSQPFFYGRLKPLHSWHQTHPSQRRKRSICRASRRAKGAVTWGNLSWVSLLANKQIIACNQSNYCFDFRNGKYVYSWRTSKTWLKISVHFSLDCRTTSISITIPTIFNHKLATPWINKAFWVGMAIVYSAWVYFLLYTWDHVIPQITRLAIY